MQTRQLGFVLVGIVILGIGIVVGRHFQTLPPSTRNPNDRLITISDAGSGKCEVDYPVAVMHYKKNHKVQWASNDNKYWISFVRINPSGTGENPLKNGVDPVAIDLNNPSDKYQVNAKEGYYKYAIFDHDPTTNSTNACKGPDDDHDTGLNIKP